MVAEVRGQGIVFPAFIKPNKYFRTFKMYMLNAVFICITGLKKKRVLVIHHYGCIIHAVLVLF